MICNRVVFTLALASMFATSALAHEFWHWPRYTQTPPTRTCTHKDLSAYFTLETAIKSFNNSSNNSHDAATVAITITEKSDNKLTQLIRFPTGPLFSAAYRDCNAVRSYSTGKNRDAEATDNDYGDLIVADFNFDGREDFAAKNDSGGNAGPLYNYYIQQTSGQFSLDTFLTQEMQFFPADINKTRRTLTTRVHAGADGLGETVFQLTKAGRWAQRSHRILPVK
jgi:hypothetical protein